MTTYLLAAAITAGKTWLEDHGIDARNITPRNAHLTLGHRVTNFHETPEHLALRTLGTGWGFYAARSHRALTYALLS